MNEINLTDKSEFQDMMQSNHLLPLITCPTRVTDRGASLIDHVWTNILSETQSGVIEVNVTEYYPILSVFKYYKNDINDKVKIEFRDINDANIGKFKTILNESDWIYILGNTNSPDNYVSNFLKYFNATFNSCFPLRKKLIGTKRILTPWLTNSLIKSIRVKHCRYKLVKRGEFDKIDYQLYCKILSKLIKTSKRQYFASVFNDIKCDIKKTWKLLNNIIGRKSKCNKTINIEVDGIRVNSQDVPNKFNEYFTTIGQKIKDNIPTSNIHFSDFLSPQFDSSIFISPTFPVETQKLIMKLNCNKIGTKQPKGKIYKLASEFISLPISIIFNAIISTGIYPNALKISCVSPIYKKDDSLNISNYRPISCLPLLNVIIEKLLHSRFSHFLEKHNLFFNDQYGFRRNHSTSDAVMKLLDRIYDSFELGDYFGTIMLDLSKAFDTVDHEVLLSKLHNYGFRGRAHQLIKSYLTERKQFVSCNGIISSTLPVSVGVPQGSVLGPLLFLIYVNDMPSVLVNGASVIQYADDTTLYSSRKEIYDLCNELTFNLSRIKAWLDTNYLSLNVSKTYFTIFTYNPIPQNISIDLNGQKIEHSPNPTFLGVTLDSKLTFDKHLQCIKSKISRSIGILWKVNYLPVEILKKSYYTLVYPYLLYCLMAWGSASNTLTNLLFLKQKKIVRIISKSDYFDPSDPIFKELNILKLNDLYKVYCSVFMFKTLYENKYDFYLDKIKSLQINLPYNTRNTEFRLPKLRLIRSRQNIVYQGISIWNKIPNHMKNNKTSSSFKKGLKMNIIDSY